MVKGYFKKQFWISFGIVVASVVVTVGALYLFGGNINDQASMIAGYRTEIQEKADAVANLATLESAAPQAEVYQTAIDQLLPDQYGLVTFPQWLAALGAKYDVTTDVAFQGAVVPSGATTPGTAQFTFSAEGSSGNLADFLAGMNERSSGFLISLGSFDVTGNGATDSMTGQGTLFFR